MLVQLLNKLRLVGLAVVACWLVVAGPAAAFANPPADEPDGLAENGELIMIFDDDDDEDESEPIVGAATDRPAKPTSPTPSSSSSSLRVDAQNQALVSPLGTSTVTSKVTTRTMLDGAFNTGQQEDVFEWWSNGRLRLHHRMGFHFSAVVEGRLVWGTRKPSEGASRWVAEPELREAYGAWQTGGWRVAVGQQIFMWGRHTYGSPADVINPIDLQHDVLRGLYEAKEAKRPVFATTVSYAGSAGTLTALWQPFFVANRVPIFTGDQALYRASGVSYRMVQGLRDFQPSSADAFLQAGLDGLQAPADAPNAGSVALRGETNLAGWDVAVVAYYGWDRAPSVSIDPDLATVAASDLNVNLAEAPGQTLDPQVFDSLLALQDKLATGTPLVTGRYRRMWLAALEAEGVLGDFVARADLGASPARTFYAADLTSHRLPTLQTMAGVEWSYGESWLVGLTGHALFVFNPPEQAPLLGIERERGSSFNPEAPGDRPVATMGGLAAQIGWRSDSGDIELGGGGVYNIAPGDYAATVRASWRGWQPLTLSAGGVFVGGQENTLGARYGHSDVAYLQASVAW